MIYFSPADSKVTSSAITNHIIAENLALVTSSQPPPPPPPLPAANPPLLQYVYTGDGQLCQIAPTSASQNWSYTPTTQVIDGPPPPPPGRDDVPPPPPPLPSQFSTTSQHMSSREHVLLPTQGYTQPSSTSFQPPLVSHHQHLTNGNFSHGAQMPYQHTQQPVNALPSQFSVVQHRSSILNQGLSFPSVGYNQQAQMSSEDNTLGDIQTDEAMNRLFPRHSRGPPPPPPGFNNAEPRQLRPRHPSTFTHPYKTAAMTTSRCWENPVPQAEHKNSPILGSKPTIGGDCDRMDIEEPAAPVS